MRQVPKCPICVGFYPSQFNLKVITSYGLWAAARRSTAPSDCVVPISERLSDRNHQVTVIHGVQAGKLDATRIAAYLLQHDRASGDIRRVIEKQLQETW